MAMLTRALRGRVLPARNLSFNSTRNLRTSARYLQFDEQSNSNPHRNFYKSHGRALFKALTLAFLSYQFFYWAWLTLETESMKDAKDHEIKSLQGEIRLLEEGRKSHRPGEMVQQQEKDVGDNRLLEQPKATK